MLKVEVTAVEAYATTDNELFHCKDKAEEHERNIQRSTGITVWTEKYCWYDMNQNDFTALLLEHGHELKELLPTEHQELSKNYKII